MYLSAYLVGQSDGGSSFEQQVHYIRMATSTAGDQHGITTAGVLVVHVHTTIRKQAVHLHEQTCSGHVHGLIAHEGLIVQSASALRER